MRHIYEIYGDNGKAMAMELLQAANAAALTGGRGVTLKPNLVVSRPASEGATTHPEIAAGAIEYLKGVDINDIVIAESSWIGDSTSRAFRVCGYEALAKKYGVKLLDMKKDPVRTVSTPAGELGICSHALEERLIINMPVLKAHCQTRMTCALKNLKGLIPDTEKRRFHSMGLHAPIAALAAAIKPEITLVDGLCGDLTFEEGGNPVRCDRMLLGFDPVQLDAYCCRLLGIEPDKIDYIRLAEQYGAGNQSIEKNDIINLNKPSYEPDYSLSGKAAALGRSVEACEACSACYGNLLHALDKTGFARNGEKLKIGQGYKGQTMGGLGIGTCASGADCCVQGCPPTADSIIKFLRGLG